MKSISWNMRDVAPRERFAYWREAVWRTYLPLVPENLSGDNFDGSIDGAAGASLHISRVRSVPATVQRTPRGIGTFQDGSFYANLQVTGESIVEQFGVRSIARPGDLVLVDTNAPFEIRFEHGCDLLCATIPDIGLRERLRGATRGPVNVIANAGAGRLASVYLNALRDIPDDFEDVDDLAGEQLATLLVRAAESQAGAAPGLAPSRRETTLRKILDLITDELDNPRLSAKFVCRELDISRTALFAILSEADITFAGHIRHLRLERSAQALRDPRLVHVTIGDIARRSGFSSQQSFARAFRRRFGVAPGAMRPRETDTH